MKPVSVSELKAHLSKYLHQVRRGGEVEVLDRGTPVARLVGLPARPEGPDEKKRKRLVRAGVLRPGKGNAASILDQRPLKLPTSVAEALDEEGKDRV